MNSKNTIIVMPAPMSLSHAKFLTIADKFFKYHEDSVYTLMHQIYDTNDFQLMEFYLGVGSNKMIMRHV